MAGNGKKTRSGVICVIKKFFKTILNAFIVILKLYFCIRFTHLFSLWITVVYPTEKYDWQIINCAPDANLRTIADISEEVWQKINEILNL